MKQELDEQLTKAFPKLYVTRIDPSTRTGIHWGFECGSGWYELIRECSARIEAINDKMADPTNHITAAQVKEKFGTLRFYINASESECTEQEWDEIDSAIREAEKKSAITCEDCGNPGKTGHTNRGWISILCEECRKKDQ